MSEFGDVYLVSTRAKPEECPMCQRGVWRALVDGFEIRVEPTPLEPKDEILLRLENPKVRIFQTLRVNGGFQLQKRTAWHITKGDPNVRVLPEHDCQRIDPGIIINFFALSKSKEVNF